MIPVLLTCAILGVTDGDTIRCETYRTEQVQIASDAPPLGLGESREVARQRVGPLPCGEPVVSIVDLGEKTGAEAAPETCTVRISWTVPPSLICEALVHEWWHLAGAGHSTDPGSIMRPDLAEHPWCDRPPVMAEEAVPIVHRIRLAAIDAPETRPPCRWVGCCAGPEARARLRELLPVGLEVRVRVTGRDRYGRLVGYVWRGITPATARSAVNYRMLREGWARFYRAFPGRWPAVYAAGEDRAEKTRRGMWRFCNPTEGATT